MLFWINFFLRCFHKHNIDYIYIVITKILKEKLKVSMLKIFYHTTFNVLATLLMFQWYNLPPKRIHITRIPTKNNTKLKFTLLKSSFTRPPITSDSELVNSSTYKLIMERCPIRANLHLPLNFYPIYNLCALQKHGWPTGYKFCEIGLQITS